MDERDDDKVDLSRMFSQDPLKDDGFTQRVMERLPARRKPSVRTIIQALFSVVACVVGGLLTPLRAVMTQALDAMSAPPSFSSFPWVAVVVLGVMVLATWLVVAEES